MLRIGVVGCGRIVERVHLDALARASGLRVTALVDPDPARLEVVSRRTPGAARYEALERLVAADSADAVVIATPPSTHTELAIEALKAGLHVYIEKPVAPDTREARSILEAHRQTDRVAVVGFNYRLHPLVRDARRRLAEVGELRAVRTVFSTAPGADPEWKRRRQTGGGALLDLGSHHVDLVRYLTGEAFEEVWASIDARGGSEASTVALHARLTGGATAQMLFALASTDADRVELFGPRGRLHYDRHRSGAVRLEPPEVRYGRPAQLRRVVGELRDGVRRVLRQPGDPSFPAAFSGFARACSGERVPELATLEDGLRSLAVLEAAEAAAATGRATVPAANADRR